MLGQIRSSFRPETAVFQNGIDHLIPSMPTPELILDLRFHLLPLLIEDRRRLGFCDARLARRRCWPLRSWWPTASGRVDGAADGVKTFPGPLALADGDSAADGDAGLVGFAVSGAATRGADVGGVVRRR